MDRTQKIKRLLCKAEIVLRGHILNPLWSSRLERRRTRGEAIQRAVCRYLESYRGFIAGLAPEGVERGLSLCRETAQAHAGEQSQPVTDGEDASRHIFSIWFQGEAAAPPLVKACWESIRRSCPEPLTVLDSETIFEWIRLPEHIVRKWKEGKIRPAHFADICRLALLEEYGGVWVDATDYVSAPFPEWLWECDFFVYMSGERQRGCHSFIQNCFIRAKKGSFLAGAWLSLIYEYWKREDGPMDYFIHQLLFKMLVENNALATREFEAMPHLCQDPTHEVWFAHGAEPFYPEKWAAMTSAALFQKTEFKSVLATSPAPGTNAYHLINSVRENGKEKVSESVSSL